MAFRVSIVASKTIIVETESEARALELARNTVNAGDLEVDEIEANEISQKELETARNQAKVITLDE